MRKDTGMQGKQNKAWAEQKETKHLSPEVLSAFTYIGIGRDRYHYNRLRTPKELTFLFLMDSTDTLHISKWFVEVE